MKKSFLVLISLSFLSLLFPISAHSKTLIVGTGEYVPFVGKNVYKQGFVNHIIEEVFKDAGYAVKYKFYPWARLYVEAQKGKVDVSSYWYANKQRKKEMYLSNPVTVEEIVFFFNKTNPLKEWKTLQDIKGYRIGVSRGYTYTEELWNLGKQGILKLDVAKADINNFKKLAKKRIDIFPASKVLGLELIRKSFTPGISDGFDFSSKPLSSVSGHVLFPRKLKDSKKLNSIFNKGLAKMKKNGIYDEYYNNMITGRYSK